MTDTVLNTDDPSREGNLSAEEYARRAEERGRLYGACHHLPDDVEVDDE